MKITSIIIFIPSVGISPRGLRKKNEKLTNRYDTQSAQPNAGKQSWSRTALKRCNNTEILWKRKHVSLASPELVEIIIIIIIIIISCYYYLALQGEQQTHR